MPAFDPLDSWFEKGFRVRAQRAAKPAREASRRRAGSGLSSTGGVKFSSTAKSTNAASVARKAPEVMVKITGNSNGLGAVKNHLDYISRNGEVELTDESGNTISGRKEVSDLRANYKAAQIPEESKKREFLHVIFSMPAGTPEREMRKAVLEFCREEFSNRRYVAAYHDDTDHAHMHVCIGTRDIDRADAPRLSPRKDDLFRWRQGFADKLRENGIEAAASERRHRFNYRKPENSVVRQIRADNPESAVYNDRRANARAIDKAIKAATRPEAAFSGPPRPPRTPNVVQAQGDALRAALAAGARPLNPHAAAIEKSKEQGLQGWAEVEKNLVEAGETDLAKAVNDLMAKGRAPSPSRAQELFDLAKSRAQELPKEKGHEL